MSVCAAFMFFTALVALLLRFVLMWENRRLDQKYGESVGGSRNTNREDIAAEDYGPRFRYAL